MIVKRPKHITMLELKQKAKGKINHIYLHWTGAGYEQADDIYHLCVDGLGQVYSCCKDLTETKPHTWMRNQGTFAIALCCGTGSRCRVPGVENPRTAWGVKEITPNTPTHCALIDFGPALPTQPQIEKMAKLVTTLCEELELPVSRDTVTTHCESIQGRLWARQRRCGSLLGFVVPAGSGALRKAGAGRGTDPGQSTAISAKEWGWQRV